MIDFSVKKRSSTVVVPDGSNDMILDDEMLDRAIQLNEDPFNPELNQDPFNPELNRNPNLEKDNSLNNRVEGGVYHMTEDANNQDHRTYTPPPLDETQDHDNEVPPIDELGLENKTLDYLEDVITDSIHQSLETYLPQMLTQIREDVIKVLIQTHETPNIVKNLNEILLVLSDLTTNSTTLINKLDMLGRSNQETRCSNLALIDQVKTLISSGPKIQQVMSTPIHPSSTTTTTVDTATQNRLIIISAVMASKNLAHENEKLLRILLTSKDDKEISKVLSMLNPTRRIISADIEILQSIQLKSHVIE